jgi:hypothetical protein
VRRGAPHGTYAFHHGGIQFPYAHTLDRDWSLFSKKEFAHLSADDCPTFSPMSRREQSLAV